MTRQPRKVTTSERATPLDHFLRRLAILGATPDEITEVRDRWDDLDDEWTVEAREQFRLAPDRVLRQALADVREEWHAHRHTTEEDEIAAGVAARAKLLEEATLVVTGAMVHVRGWVGGDTDRAEAALAAELCGKQRPMMLAELRAMLAPPT